MPANTVDLEAYFTFLFRAARRSTIQRWNSHGGDEGNDAG